MEKTWGMKHPKSGILLHTRGRKTSTKEWGNMGSVNYKPRELTSPSHAKLSELISSGSRFLLISQLCCFHQFNPAILDYQGYAPSGRPQVTHGSREVPRADAVFIMREIRICEGIGQILSGACKIGMIRGQMETPCNEECLIN